MASATLTNLGKRFPAATSVGVYLASQKRIGAAPSASALSSATVTADHKLTFTALTPGVKYVAYASVSSEHRYVDFEVGKQPTSQLLIPSSGVVETVPGRRATGNIAALASGTLYLAACVLPGGQPIGKVGCISATTALSGGTHSWAVVADSALTVKAVSADDTTATLAANTLKEFTMKAAYTPAEDELGYLGVCFVGTVPTLQGVTLNNAVLASTAPKLCGTSNTSQTTEPAVGATLTAITGTALLAYLYGA